MLAHRISFVAWLREMSNLVSVELWTRIEAIHNNFCVGYRGVAKELKTQNQNGKQGAITRKKGERWIVRVALSRSASTYGGSLRALEAPTDGWIW